MTVVPASITFDGSADVADDLTTWLATPSNYPDGVVTFQQDGIYRVDDGNIEIVDAADLVLDFNGATIRRTRPPDVRYTQHSSALYLRSSATNVTIRNMVYEGVNDATSGYLNTWADAETGGGLARFYRSDGTTLDTADPPSVAESDLPNWGCYCVAMAFDHAIEVVTATNVVVEDCDISGPFGDGVYFHTAVSGVTVQRVDVRRCGRQGIAFNKGTDILVDSCNIYSARHAAIDLECDDAGQTISDVEIRSCYFNSWLTSFASIGPGAVDDVWFHHNTVYRNCIQVGTNNAAIQRYRWRIEDNTFNQAVIDGTVNQWSSPLGIINLDAYSDAVIARNYAKFLGSHSGHAVELTGGCSNIMVFGNHFEGNVNGVVLGVEDSTWIEGGNSLTSTPPDDIDRSNFTGYVPAGVDVDLPA